MKNTPNSFRVKLFGDIASIYLESRGKASADRALDRKQEDGV